MSQVSSSLVCITSSPARTLCPCVLGRVSRVGLAVGIHVGLE
jgi:hypothetical protein